MTFKDYEKLIPKLIEQGGEQPLTDAVSLIRNYMDISTTYIIDHDGNEISAGISDRESEKALTWLKALRERILALLVSPDTATEELDKAYWDTLLLAAPHDFDSYCLYIEKDREPNKRFYQPRRKQLQPLAHALNRLELGHLELLGISLPPGIGKALANDTPIMTRYGWKNHGDLVVGDEVVGLNGKYKKVIAVHPKCMLDCQVEFTNGEKIVCHENHEWMVHDRARHENHDYIAETKYFEQRKIESGGERGHRGHRYIMQLPHREYMEGTISALPLDPYVFGVWLGDGANKNPRICGAKSDYAIIEKIVSKGYPVRWQTEHKITGVMYYDFDIRKELQTYGLCHSRQINPKYIPDEYLTADIEQRLELLAGLLDTDGTLSRECRYHFTTSEPTLRDSFLDLIATFGWRCSVKTVQPCTSSSGITARYEHYAIAFCPDTFIPCALERKQIKKFAKREAISMKEITRVEPKEGNCITVEGDGMYLAGKKMIPTHNTTLAIFFITWTSGLHPELQSLIGSHNNEFLRGVYDECLRIFDKDGEYRWHDVFPHVGISGTNAKDLRIDLGLKKRFQTIELTSLGSGNAGKVRATNLLYCDDLCEGIEQAMSPDQMQKLWQKYTVDLRQRKQGNRVKELHIQTRWSVNDVVGRLQEIYDDNWKAQFINIPALDENGESNFNYPYGVGFTTEMYEDLRNSMDDASWRALYMGQPIEREGQLYPPEELRRYFDLPETEPDAVLAVCDSKEQGGDFCAMPIAYKYGDDYYIEDWICDNGSPDNIQVRIVEKLIAKGVQHVRVESNRGGTLFAKNIQDALKSRGSHCKVTTKWNQTNKETRILVASAWVKEHCLFKDESWYAKANKEYRTAMQQLCGYALTAKNKHDDVPDSMADLENFVKTFEGNKITIKPRTFF